MQIAYLFSRTFTAYLHLDKVIVVSRVISGIHLIIIIQEHNV